MCRGEGGAEMLENGHSWGMGGPPCTAIGTPTSWETDTRQVLALGGQGSQYHQGL